MWLIHKVLHILDNYLDTRVYSQHELTVVQKKPIYHHILAPRLPILASIWVQIAQNLYLDKWKGKRSDRYGFASYILITVKY